MAIRCSFVVYFSFVLRSFEGFWGVSSGFVCLGLVWGWFSVGSALVRGWFGVGSALLWRWFGVGLVGN